MSEVQNVQEVKEVKSLKVVMAEKGEPTLKAIAMAHNLPPVRLYSVAKQPIEGEVYDANKYNWDAIEKFIARRFDEEGFQNFEQVIDAALEIDEDLKQSDGRRNRGSSVERIQVGDKMVTKRRHPSFEMDANMFVVLKDDINVYKIVYQTETHTVLVPVDNMEGSISKPDVVIKSNGMLNYKGIGPADLDKAIEDNFKAQAELKAQESKAEEAKADEAPADAAPAEEAVQKRRR